MLWVATVITLSWLLFILLLFHFLRVFSTNESLWFLTGVTASLLWYCRTLLSILADIDNAVVWMVYFVYDLFYSL